MDKSSSGIRKVKYTSPVRRSRRRRTEKIAEPEYPSLEQTETEQLLLGEKGILNEESLVDGTAKFSIVTSTSSGSGCPSSTINLSSGENSSPPLKTTTATTAEEQLQSMLVNSRSKRVRGTTTTTTAANQHKRIAYTDRKTRSTSSCPIVDAINPTIDNNNETPKTESLLNNDNNENVFSESKPEVSDYEKNLSNNIVESHKNEKKLSKLTTTTPCEEGENKGESVSETLENSNCEFPTIDINFKSKSNTTNSAGGVLPDWKGSTSTNQQQQQPCENQERAEKPKVIASEVNEKIYGVNSNSFTGDGVNSSAKSNINNNNTNVIKKLVEEKKLNLAPMLLMNNLPYMGELTFDTRPRRGRKPKKADICHLISKNYGIHFPNSYTNVPNTGCSVPASTTTVSTLPQTKSQTTKGKHTKKNSSKSSANSFSSCPPTNWTIPSPPDLLPIAMPNRSNLKSSTSTSKTRSISMSKSFHNNQTGKISSTKSINRNKTPAANLPEILSASCSSSSSSISAKRSSQQDEPLNLCVRDATQNKSPRHSSSPNLAGFNGSYAGIMNLKLPLISPNSLFSDFHLKSHSTRTEQSGGTNNTRGFDGNNRNSNNNNGNSGEGNNKVTKESNENKTTVGDLSLVNKLSLQLSLANASANFHGQPSLINKSHGKSALRFAPPITNDSPFVLSNSSKEISHKKSKKRRSMKTDDSNQSELKSQLSSIPSASSSSSSHIFLNPSSVHPTSNVNDSHAGGCLFGQPDSGPSSGAQVSICKFKFTGGAKPSLQEKKMLSVDSGGNFRFYTDKCSGSSSIKSIKNSHSGGGNHSSTSSSFNNTAGESYGEQDCQYAFSSLPKSAKSMSVCMPVRPSSLQIPTTSFGQGLSLPLSSTASNKIIEKHASPSSSSSIPVSPAAVQLNNLHIDNSSGGGGLTVPPGFQDEDGYSSSESDNSNSNSGTLNVSSLTSGGRHYQSDSSRCSKLRSKRKRRTRKSLMREKLEKTFKEKGFLIQTQQLESAEGATYCKFRQLRKFTRYLFRSWKDYLPDNVREINNTGVNEGEGSAVNLATSSGVHGERGGSGESGMEMELDLQTTNSQHHNNNNNNNNGSREDSDEDNDEDFEEQEDEGMDELIIPEVTLTTQPSSPVTLTNHQHSSSSSSSTNNNSDSEASNDVDVENIDDNSSLRYNNNPTINIINHNEDNDTTPHSTDNV